MEEIERESESRSGHWGELGTRVLFALVAGSASWIVVTSAHDQPTTALLIPIFAALSAICGIFCRHPVRTDFSTLLIVSTSFLRPVEVQLVMAGAAWASSLLVIVWWAREERWELGGSVITAAAVAPMLLSGVPAGMEAPALLGTAGIVILERTLRGAAIRSRFTRALSLSAAVALASVLPVSSLRVASIALVLAIAISLRSRRSLLYSIAATLLGFVSGLWLGAVVGITTVSDFLRGRLRSDRAASNQLVPLQLTISSAFIQPLLLVPVAFARARIPDLVPLAAAVAVAIVARPAIAPLVVLVGAIFVLGAGRLERREPSWLALSPLAVTAIVAVVVTAWSGAFRVTIPLAFPLAAAVPLAYIGLGGWMGRAGGLVTAALAVVAVTFMPQPAGLDEVTTLETGESVTYRAPLPSMSTEIILAGVDLSALEPGRVVGTISILEESGSAHRIPVAVGDLSDWGAFRPGYLYRTKNSLPEHSVRQIEGFGSGAWLHGAGRVPIESDTPIMGVRITAGDLAAGQTLQVYGARWGNQ